MKKSIINLISIFSFILFTAFVFLYYFSEKNKIKTNKYITFYYSKESNILNQLPILPNDTANIIEYIDDANNSTKKKIKRKFWELLDK